MQAALLGRFGDTDWSRNTLAAGVVTVGQAVQSVIIGRRNWLFVDTQAGAEASADLYWLRQTCSVNGIDGYRYLKAIPVARPKAKTVDEFEALLPWRFALD
jgi:transposase